MLAKKLRKLADNLAGQPTDLAGVGCSVFFILRSVDALAFCRLNAPAKTTECQKKKPPPQREPYLCCFIR
jgi:hypothetical protein